MKLTTDLSLTSGPHRARHGWHPGWLFRGGVQGVWYDPSDLLTLYLDTAGTSPVTAPGQAVARIEDLSGNDNHAVQAVTAARPILAVLPATGRRNLLLQTDTLETQTRTVAATVQTLSFRGTGSVTLSGASTDGPLVGAGADEIVALTFTPAAGSLTLTVSGAVEQAQLETGTSRTAYQRVGNQHDVTEAGVRNLWHLYFDGVDDGLSTWAQDFMAGSAATSALAVRALSGSDALCYRSTAGTGVGHFTYRLWKSPLVHQVYQSGGTGTALDAGDMGAPAFALQHGSHASWNTRLNGVSVATRDTGQDLDFDVQETGQKLHLGWNGVAGTAAMRFFGGLLVNRDLTGTEIARLERAGAFRAGVTLT